MEEKRELASDIDLDEVQKRGGNRKVPFAGEEGKKEKKEGGKDRNLSVNIDAFRNRSQTYKT